MSQAYDAGICRTNMSPELFGKCSGVDEDQYKRVKILVFFEFPDVNMINNGGVK